MAKDPAFLFYPNDWLGGTLGMTFEEKGAYMELLMLQFNRGHMTYHMMGQTVGQMLDKLLVKFVKDVNGLYFNQRLEEEQIKRKCYINSRLNNKKGINQHTKKRGHMIGHMENENINENVINNYFEKSEKLFCDLTKNEADTTVEYISRTAQKKFTKSELENLFAAFRVQYEKDFYQNRNKVIQHFRNWLKQQQNGSEINSKGNGAVKLGTSDARIAALRA